MYLDERTSYGWEENIIQTVSCQLQSMKAFPEQLLKLIRCFYESDMPCKTQMYGYNSSIVASTIFCSCHMTVQLLISMFNILVM